MRQAYRGFIHFVQANFAVIFVLGHKTPVFFEHVLLSALDNSVGQMFYALCSNNERHSVRYRNMRCRSPMSCDP